MAADDYYIDLERFTLEHFKNILASKDLLPSRLILKERMGERFAVLESMGIDNLQALWQALKTKKRLEQFATASGLSQEYLVILRREVNSYIPKPISLTGLPDVEGDYLERMADEGIKTTKDLFHRAKTKQQRAELSKKLDIPPEVLLELVKLSDLARIVGVGPIFARILYEAGIDHLQAFVQGSPDELLVKVQEVNAAKGYSRASVTEKDIVYCLETATLLPQVVEYE